MELAIPSDFVNLANNLYNQGLSDSEVTVALQKKGASESLLSEIMLQIKKGRAIKRRNRGFIWCGTGVFFLVLGCLLTFVLLGNQTQMRVVMYGLTTIGVCIILKGLADVIGW